MILHSIKSIIRTPKKTILFLFLIALLSMFLSIGAGMYQSAINMLKEADETFTTVVELNYLGEKGDDEIAYYERMNRDLEGLDTSSLLNQADVLSVNMENTALAYIEDKQINQNLSAINEYVIIEVIRVRPYNEAFYQATINKVHFGKTMRENTYVLINNIDEFGVNRGYDFDFGNKYLLIGKESAGQNPTPVITPGLPEGIEGYEALIDLNDAPDYYDTEEGVRLLKLVDAFHVVSTSLPVTMVTSLEASEPYFNRNMIISEGRVFNAEEYQDGSNKVIIISRNLADFYNVGVGDKLNLNLHYARNGFGLSDYLTDHEFSEVAEYEIVGVFDNKNENRFSIYMPGAEWIKQGKYSPTIARFMVENGSGGSFIDRNSDELPVFLSFTLYDQGYEEAIKPINELKDIAILLLILGGISGAIILLLFAYLYVYKQRFTLMNMLALGAGKRRTFRYIVFGSSLLIFLASSLGAFASAGFLNKLTNSIFERMIDIYGTDIRYSERALGLQLEYTANVEINYWLPVLITLIMLISSIILILGLTIFIINEDGFKSRRIKKKAAKKLKKLPGTQNIKISKEQNVLFGKVRPLPLKYALVSIIRNAERSLIVPVLALVLAIFLVFLNFLSNIQVEKREKVYDNIPVNAYLTSFMNESRDIGGLRLQYDIYRLIDPEYQYRMEYTWRNYEEFQERYTSKMASEERDKILMDSEFFKEMYLYSSIHYEYMGVAKSKDGIENKELASIPNVRKHKDAFGYDWFIEAIKKMPRLAYADDLRFTPDFFETTSPEVEFFDGYGFESLRLLENVGFISRRQAIEEGIELGDTIRITGWTNLDTLAICSLLDIKVVGIYEQGWRSDVIYLPWIMSYDHNYFVDYYYTESPENIENEDVYRLWNESLARNVRSATFTLKNTQNLDSFREYLNTWGYSEAGKIKFNRNAVVIQDKNLEETIKTLDNYIRLMDTLIPLMLILFGIIGFMVSYLLIRHRLNELAIMRSIGVGKTKVFLAFFIEQLILFIIGLLPVLIFGMVFPTYFIYYRVSLGYFVISYLAGTAVALLVLGRTKLLDILFSKE
jgi:hypothetical protein